MYTISEEGDIFGYIRVSSKDQKLDRQLDAMKDQNVPLKNIYYDKITGSTFERPGYKRLLRKVKKGDLIIVKSIDRFGRDYEEIENQWRIITKEKRVDVQVLDMPLLNTRESATGLTGVLIADLVLKVLAYVADIERKNNKHRQREGIESARQKGVKFGRPKKEIDISKWIRIVKSWRNNEISCQEACAHLDCSRSFFYKKIKDLQI